MRIAPAHDAHVHLTSLEEDGSGSVGALLALMDDAGVRRAAVVTPSTLGWDNSVSLGAVDAAPDRFVAIVRVDLSAPDAVGNLTAALDRGARGLRLTLVDQDSELLDLPVTIEAARTLADRAAVLEVHARTDQLGAVRRFARRHPTLTIVVDHLGRPDPAGSPTDSRYSPFRALADQPNVVAKTPNASFFSTLPAPYPDIAPYLEYALDAWGPDRLMWGSDWPVCTTRATYAEAFQPLLSVVESSSSHVRDAVFRTTFERTLGAP